MSARTKNIRWSPRRLPVRAIHSCTACYTPYRQLPGGSGACRKSFVFRLSRAAPGCVAVAACWYGEANQSHDCRERVSLSGLNGPPEKPHAGSAYSQPTQPTLSTQAALSKDAARGGPRPVVNNRSGLSREPHCAALRRPFCVRLNRSTCGCQGCCGGPRGAADASREGRGREAGQGVHRRAEPRHAARVRCKP
jgi:hypothetical protein